MSQPLTPLRALRAAIVTTACEVHRRLGLAELLTLFRASRNPRASWSRAEVLQAIEDAATYGKVRLDMDDPVTEIFVEFVAAEPEVA